MSTEQKLSYADPTPEQIDAANAFIRETTRGGKSLAEKQARVRKALEMPGNEALRLTVIKMAVKAAVEEVWPTRFKGQSELDKYTAAQAIARKLRYTVRKADHPNERKRYTLNRKGMETHFATIDEVIAALDKVRAAA